MRRSRSKLPKCNGRPQLWYSIERAIKDSQVLWDRLRIIYPNGRVEYCYEPTERIDLRYMDFAHGCTSRGTQTEAVEAIVKYSDSANEELVFLGYL